MTQPDRCRFCRLFAASVVGFGLLLGVFTTLQFAPLLTKFGGGQDMARALVQSVVRSTAPAVSGSALLLALVLWSHPLSLAALQADLPRISRRALLISLPGYLAALLVTMLSAFVVAGGALGQSFGALRAALAALGGLDALVGAVGTVLEALLILFLAFRYLARLQAARLSLPAKLIIVLTVSVPLRATVGLIYASLLSG